MTARVGGDSGRENGDDGGGVRSLGGGGDDILASLFGVEVAIIGGNRSAGDRRERLGGEPLVDGGVGDFGGVFGFDGRFCFRRLTFGELS